MLSRPLQQGVVNGFAGGIGGVRDTPHRVPAFAGEMQAQRAVGVRRERHAGLDQPAYGTLTLLGDKTRGVLVHEARAGILRVLHVAGDAVVAAQHAHDAALRPGRGALVQLALGQHHHRQSLRQVQCHGQATETGADHDHRGRLARCGRG